MLNFMVGSLFAGIIIIISMTIFHVGEEYSKIVVSNGFVSIVAKRYDGVQQKYVDTVRATIPKERFRFRENVYQPSKCWVDDETTKSGYTIQMSCTQLLDLIKKETN